jgi:hypothetical protein
MVPDVVEDDHFDALANQRECFYPGLPRCLAVVPLSFYSFDEGRRVDYGEGIENLEKVPHELRATDHKWMKGTAYCRLDAGNMLDHLSPFKWILVARLELNRHVLN